MCKIDLVKNMSISFQKIINTNFISFQLIKLLIVANLFLFATTGFKCVVISTIFSQKYVLGVLELNKTVQSVIVSNDSSDLNFSSRTNRTEVFLGSPASEESAWGRGLTLSDSEKGTPPFSTVDEKLFFVLKTIRYKKC